MLFNLMGVNIKKSDIEKMISSKKIDGELIAYLCEYIAYSVTNKYGDDEGTYTFI